MAINQLKKFFDDCGFNVQPDSRFLFKIRVANFNVNSVRSMVKDSGFSSQVLPAGFAGSVPCSFVCVSK